MSNESTQFILGDAAVDATTEGRRGRRRRERKLRRRERVLTHCENCGAELAGEYCAKCGQHAIDYHRSLWAVMIDAADSFFNWDTKFISSLGVLLAKPWKLTNDFNAGRRARYVHPLRLYLLASIAFFLMLKLANINGSDVIQLDPKDRAEIAAALGKLTGSDSSLTAEQQATVEAMRSRIAAADGALNAQEKKDIQKLVQTAMATKMKDKFERGERARLKAALRKIPQIPSPDDAAENADDAAEKAKDAAANVKDVGNIAREATDQANKEVAAELAAERAAEAATPAMPAAPGDIAPPLPAPPAGLPSAPPRHRNHPKPGIHFNSDDGKPKTPIEKWFQDRVKSKMGEDGSNSKLFLETLRNNIPTMMLCCIPLFALVLKMLYLGKRRYYVEHLVYALHIHTFVYVAVTLITLLSLGLARFSDTARGLSIAVLSIATVVQVFLSIRRVYGQGWFFSTFKFLLGGVVYLVIIVLAVGVTAFITLLLPE